MRYNIVTYFALSTLIAGVVLAWSGVVTFAVIRQALVLMIPYGLGLWVGTHGFHRASDVTFRGPPMPSSRRRRSLLSRPSIHRCGADTAQPSRTSRTS
jgi:hypothetical protein